jgi:Domain of Unknown Function (DUF1080)
MKHLQAVAVMLSLVALSFLGCVQSVGDSTDSGWITLLEGGNLDHWTMLGNANWRLVDGAVQADQGNGHLVSKNSYSDFQIRAEFWVDTPANSGIFIRCADAKKIGTATCYEVNINDDRPEQDYSTGAIVDVAKVSPPIPKAGGRWNLLEITAKGPQMSVILNGVRTAEGRDGKFSNGPITIQYTRGVVKFRKLQIKPL